MRHERISAAAAFVAAAGIAIAIGTTALTPVPAGFSREFVEVTSQSDDPGDDTNSATKVTVLNASTATCNYKVRFLNKYGAQVCELAASLAPGKQTNFSSADIPNDVYRSYYNCNPALDDYKGHVEVFVSNVSTCRQRSLVDSFRVHWDPKRNGCKGTCETAGTACSSDTECVVTNSCENVSGACLETGAACTSDDDCPGGPFYGCQYACPSGGTCGAECAPETCIGHCDGGVNDGQPCTSQPAECPRNPCVFSGTCAVGGQACMSDTECPSTSDTCNFACKVTGEMCSCDEDCPRVGLPVTADRVKSISYPYSLKWQLGD